MDSLVVETALGLLFVFAVFSALVSMLTEAVSRLIGLRGEHLLRGIRSLVDDGSALKLPWGDLFRRRSSSPAPRSDESETPMVTKLLGQPIVARSGDKGTLPEHAGWTLMVIALLSGARFWFDALSRLGTLRSTGPKPDSKPPSPRSLVHVLGDRVPAPPTIRTCSRSATATWNPSLAKTPARPAHHQAARAIPRRRSLVMTRRAW